MLKSAATAVVLSLCVVSAWGDGINWQRCSSINPSIECGSFRVPLDYADSSAGYAYLAVTRYRSNRTPHLGTIFTNPGGPGDSGTSTIFGSIAETILGATNGQYDIISWDPRGVNLTLPAISCGFRTAEELADFLHGTIIGDGIEARGNFTDTRDVDAFLSRVDQTDAKIKEFGERCLATDGGFLKYMGTAAVVRDMVYLADYIEGKDKGINYWGFSYGTIIGSYFVNMFPDRVGRVIIDGVVDPVVYSTRPAHEMWSTDLKSAEDTFVGFTQACAQAGPSGCAIAEEGSTPESVAQWVKDLIDASYDQYREGADVASSFIIRATIYDGMYHPQTWVTLAKTLAGFAETLANLTSSTQSSKRAESFPSVLTNGTNQVPILIATLTIQCLDNIDPGKATTEDVFNELLLTSQHESPLFGVLMKGTPAFYCHRYPVRAVERYTGPFNRALANPILVIGNEADPITPLASAKSVADALGSSAYLVEQDDFGHASVAERSDCTTAVVADYFLEGKLPTKGKFCGTNQALFPGAPVTKGSVAAVAALSQSGGNNSTDSNPDNSSEISKLQRDHKLYLIIISVLAVLTAVFAIALVTVCFTNRKNTRYATPYAAAALVSKDDFSAARGSMDGLRPLYSDPKKTAY